jgi:hypothetical protein
MNFEILERFSQVFDGGTFDPIQVIYFEYIKHFGKGYYY